MAIAWIVSLFDDGADGGSTEPAATELSTTPTPTAREPKPEWEASIYATRVVDSATVRVTFLVKNTGDAPGRPECKMTVRDRPGDYTGSEISTAKEPIKPGKFTRLSVLITVKNEGARYATYEKVKCTTV